MSTKVTEKTISQVVIETQDKENIIENIVLPLEQVVTAFSGEEKESLDKVLSWGAFGNKSSN